MCCVSAGVDELRVGVGWLNVHQQCVRGGGGEMSGGVPGRAGGGGVPLGQGHPRAGQRREHQREVRRPRTAPIRLTRRSWPTCEVGVALASTPLMRPRVMHQHILELGVGWAYQPHSYAAAPTAKGCLPSGRSRLGLRINLVEHHVGE